jgi:nitroreductase
VDAFEMLTTTRSVRLRLDLSRPVALTVIRECIRVALQAPNGGGRESWHWIVVTAPALRQEIGAIYRAAFQARYPEAGDTTPLSRSASCLARNLGRVPVLVLPCLRVADHGLPVGSQAGLWGSVLPAAWSYMLAARAYGLATAWTSVHLDAEKAVAQVLQIPPEVRQAALIPTAHPLGGGFRPARRRPLDDVLHLDGWGGRGEA